MLLYASSHRQDSTYHSLCYTSRGAVAGTRYINTAYVFICIIHHTDRITHTTAFVTPVSRALAGMRNIFNTAYVFVCIIHHTDRITHTTAFVTPVSAAPAGTRNINTAYVFICIISHTDRIAHTTAFVTPVSGRKEGNVLFNDALNTFYLQLYGVGHMVKDHSDSEKGNPLPPHRLLFLINSKGSFTDRIAHTLAFVTPVVEHWLERDILIQCMFLYASSHRETG